MNPNISARLLLIDRLERENHALEEENQRLAKEREEALAGMERLIGRLEGMTRDRDRLLCALTRATWRQVLADGSVDLATGSVASRRADSEV